VRSTLIPLLLSTVMGSPALAQRCQPINSSGEYKASEKKFIVDPELIYPQTDILSYVRRKYGDNASVADWEQLKQVVNSRGRAEGFIRSLSLELQMDNHSCGNYLITVRGNTHINGMRFLLTRHDGQVPAGWSPLDSIGNHNLDLGRWNWPGHIIVVMDQQQKPRALPNSSVSVGPPQIRTEAAQEQKQSIVDQPSSNRTEVGGQPRAQLVRSYRAYIDVKKCFDSRKGYAAVYLNEEQMQRARQWIKGIEGSLTSANRDLETSLLWKEANEPEKSTAEDSELAAIMQLGDIVGRGSLKNADWDDESSNFCKRSYENLRVMYEKLTPGSGQVTKDF